MMKRGGRRMIRVKANTTPEKNEGGKERRGKKKRRWIRRMGKPRR